MRHIATMKITLISSIVITLILRATAVAQPPPEQWPKPKKEMTQSAASLNDYVGRYGKKEIFVRDGGLYYQRIGGRGGVLRPIGKDKFALADDAQLTFKRDAKGVVIEVAIDWVAFPDELLKREPLTGGPSTGVDPTLRVPVRKEPPSSSSSEPALDAATLAQLKTIMTYLLETIYVSPEIGARLAKQLKEKFESGAYASAADQAELAGLLTRDLREWSNDRHLNVRYEPTATAEPILDPESWEKQKPSMFPRATNDPGPRGRQPGPRMVAQLEQDNYHFRQTKTLKGNVGYLELAGFAPGSTAQEKAAQAMSALAKSDAVIIDLRECPGGSADMVDFLASYFFDAEPRVLMNRYFRPTDEQVQDKTLANIPGTRMPETDLYILVSAHTASAGESFAYTLQQYGRARIVGEKTAGAGYNNIILPLGKGLAFSVSYGRPEHPRSGKGWEAVGVQPDIAVPAGEALAAAHKSALQKMIGKTTDERRKTELTAALQELHASSGSNVDAEQQLRHLERAWLDAYEQHDAAAMESILADDFAITHPDGQTETRAQVLETVKRMREKSATSAMKFATEDVQVRINGDTALLSGKLVEKSGREGATPTQFAYVDTYAKRDGRWQVVSSRLKHL